MIADEKHRKAVELFQLGKREESLSLLREVLAEEDSDERWNDWAMLQFVLGNAQEAEAGFRLALEIAPGNAQAALNLGALLNRENRNQEAIPWLRRALSSGDPPEKSKAEELLQKMPPSEEAPRDDEQVERYLSKFVSQDENERSYFETHVKRYVATLNLLPNGTKEMLLLELGAAFHHLTPALVTCKGYGEVRCNDIWEGEKEQLRRVNSNRGDEQFSFRVHNFDVQAAPWPLDSGNFDAVLCCEMLEHLYSDPMALFSEINRILKTDGVLLLSTPNLACSHAVEYVLRGESPYVYGRFERDGRPTDRHNREYTTGEVERLAAAAGFEIAAIRTIDSWWRPSREILRSLASQGFPIARRGDNTLLLARKRSEVLERYPEEFYQNVGTQSERRALQSGQPELPVKRTEYVSPRNILVIHENMPRHDCSGADLRLFEILREIRAQGHSVTLIARDGREFDRYGPQLQALEIKVMAGDPDRFRHSGEDKVTEWNLRELLERGRFHAAILCHWYWCGISVVEQYWEFIRQFSPETRILVLSDDRHGERERRLANLSGLFGDRERAADFEAREAEAYSRADLVLYITEADRKRFLEICPGLQTELLPMYAETGAGGPGYDEREGVLFLGNFENPANNDALQWMLTEIWPLVRAEDPGIMLYVAGNAAPANLEGQHRNVKSLGRVERLEPLFAARRVFAAPIRYGTGINTKNLHAMAHGLPVVTTTIGTEGILAENARHALIADCPADFAAALLRLHRDAAFWQRLASEGRKFVESRFSLPRLQEQIRKIIFRIGELQPKTPERDPLWSFREVERFAPRVLTQQPGIYRSMLRVLAYWQLGKSRQTEGRFGEALVQYRHIFAILRGHTAQDVFHAQFLRDMADCYRELGDAAAAERCERESRIDRSQPHSRRSERHKKPKPGANKPEISVIIPTCNRAETLHLCLSALAFQTLPAKSWEVIVVDDGSSDGTAEMCDRIKLPFSTLRVIRQENQGVGAARQAGVAAARGEFVLFFNDDTIAGPRVLEEHLRTHRQNPHKKLAVLGDFRPSDESKHRALSFWVNHSSFFFPQRHLKAGQLLGCAEFVSCNLSVRREAVLRAGNFDPDFRVAEDTELGWRLFCMGYRVLYHPAACAWHEHGVFTSNDLLRRAQAYGAADWALFQKHPQLLGEGTSPFGMLRPEDFSRLQKQVEANGSAVEVALTALKDLDEMEILPLLEEKSENGRSAADDMMRLLSKTVPLVYWHHLFQSFLAARERAGASARPSAQADPARVSS